MGESLVVVVHGVPGPQGSKRHVGHGVMVESSAKVAPWREAVRAATVTALGWNPNEVVRAVDDPAGDPWRPARDAALSLYAVFTLSRPASHYRSGKYAASLRDTAPDHPATRPDVDKLLRSTFDALTDAGAMAEDSRVVHVNVTKAYPGGHVDALDAPGAVLVLSAI